MSVFIKAGSQADNPMIEGFWFEIEDSTFRDSGFNRRAKPFSTPCLANDDSEGTDRGSARLAWRKSTDDVVAKTPQRSIWMTMDVPGYLVPGINK